MRNHNAGVPGERRAHVRYSHTLKGSCRPLGRETGAWSATVQDISRSGVALVMNREVRPGSVLVVALEGVGGRFARPLLLRVTNTRPGMAGRWHVGCAFVKPLTEDDLQALLLTPASRRL
jgi:PilZ domain